MKIDFFAGDGKSMIAYYLGILRAAADAGLLVNFHGATCRAAGPEHGRT